MMSLDYFKPMEEIVPPLSEHFFSSINSAIIKGRLGKRKIDLVQETPKQLMVWNATNLNDEEFAKEIVDALGAFSKENKWSISNMRKQMTKMLKNGLAEQYNKCGNNIQKNANKTKTQIYVVHPI